MLIDRLHTEWEVGFHEKEDQSPTAWHPARVPGAVQLDMLHTLDDPDWTRGEGFRQFRWMEDVWWTYRTRFDRPSLRAREKLCFRSRGIDYAFAILLNGMEVHRQEGMFRYVDLDLTDLLEEENELQIVIAPVPKSNHDAEDRNQANHSFKPAVSYGWDWHPRLVPSGIWDETAVEIRRDPLRGTTVTYLLDESMDSASVNVEGVTDPMIRSLAIRVEFEGETVQTNEFEYRENKARKGEFRKSLVLENVKLWWPAGLGKPNLYSITVSAYDNEGQLLDEKLFTIGFRKVKLVRNKGTEREDDSFPKSRLLPPITLEINHRRIFAQGTNWVNPEVFPGRLDDERYRELLELAAGAGFNILRVWGGGIVNKQYFHDWCDRNGMMVWQEFPLACNQYPDDESYLSVLRSEAYAIIERLKQHPSLVIWSGGNELYNSWSGMDDQSLPIRWLNSLCLELSPDIPFIPTSPLQGMGHGHYLFHDTRTNEDICQIMARSEHTALTEYGVPSPSDTGILRKIIPEGELFPPSNASRAWKVHHGFDSWQEDTWLCIGTIEKYFGKQESLEELVKNGQKLQAAGYRFIYEAARQKWPRCSMAINWCFNEPWPCAANNSIIQYPSLPKPAYDSIRKACRPVLASASFPKYMWQEGETFRFDVFLLNHANEDLPQGKMIIYINGMEAGHWEFEKVEAHTSLKGPGLEQQAGETLEISLRVEGHPEWDSIYELPVTKNQI
ncbi:MAG: glycoside hydrolase family 2 TIM barrel-domain containing protein [Bacteroidales bacterium]